MLSDILIKKNNMHPFGIEMVLSRANYKYYEFNKNDVSIKLATGQYILGSAFQIVGPDYCKKIYEGNDFILNCDTVIFPDASKHGWLIEITVDNGILSAKNEPALKQYNKDKPSVDAVEYWFNNGLPHREDGFAIFSTSGKEYNSYWLNGTRLTFEQFWDKQKDTIYASKIMSEILGQKENKDAE